MNNKNLYSIGKFGGIPVGTFFKTTPERFGGENQEILVCEWLEEEGALYIDGEKIEYFDNKKPLKDNLFQAVNITLFNQDTDFVKSHIDTYTEQAPPQFGDSRLITDYLLRDLERLKKYTAGICSRRDRREKDKLLFERDTDLERLQRRLVSFYATFLDPIEEDLTLKLESEVRKTDKEHEGICQAEKRNRKKKVVLESILSGALPSSETIQNKAIESPIPEEQEITPTGEKDTIQPEESSIPEGIQKRVAGYLEKGYITHIEGEKHYRLTGLSMIHFMQENKNNPIRLTQDEVQEWIWKKTGEQYSKGAINKRPRL